MSKLVNAVPRFSRRVPSITHVSCLRAILPLSHSHRLNIHPRLSRPCTPPHASFARHRRPQASPLDSVLASPLPGGRLVSRTVGLVHVRDLGNERVVGVGVRQHRADGEKHCDLSDISPFSMEEAVIGTFADGQSWAPLITENVETDAAVGVDVGVVDAGGEVDLGRLEGVVGREVDGEEEYASRVG